MNKTLELLIEEFETNPNYKIDLLANNCYYDTLTLLKQIREATIKECLSKLTINLVEYAKYGGKIIKTENLGEEIPTEDPQKYYQVNKDMLIDLNRIEI